VLFEPNARRYRPLVLAISALGVALAVAGAHRRTA
jgi:hypothetical protein